MLGLASLPHVELARRVAHAASARCPPHVGLDRCPPPCPPHVGLVRCPPSCPPAWDSIEVPPPVSARRGTPLICRISNVSTVSTSLGRGTPRTVYERSAALVAIHGELQHEQADVHRRDHAPVGDDPVRKPGEAREHPDEH